MQGRDSFKIYLHPNPKIEFMKDKKPRILNVATNLAAARKLIQILLFLEFQLNPPPPGIYADDPTAQSRSDRCNAHGAMTNWAVLRRWGRKSQFPSAAVGRR
jgi:hypothetical protein